MRRGRISRVTLDAAGAAVGGTPGATRADASRFLGLPRNTPSRQDANPAARVMAHRVTTDAPARGYERVLDS